MSTDRELGPPNARTTDPAPRDRAPDGRSGGREIISVRAVQVRHSTGFRLGPIDLAIQRGDRIALIGPNGSGKTTLVRLLAGLLRPDSGVVLVDGRPVHTLARASVARRIAVVPQEIQIPFAFSVGQVIALGRTAHRGFWGGSTAADGAAIQRAIESTGLADFVGRSYQSLSGGERQRVILAMALAQEAEVLLLDEPTAHLDLRARVELMSLVERHAGERGITVLAAVHDLSLASQFFGRIVLLADGKLAADSAPPLASHEELLRQVFGAGLHVMTNEDGDEVVTYRRRAEWK